MDYPLAGFGSVSSRLGRYNARTAARLSSLPLGACSSCGTIVKRRRSPKWLWAKMRRKFGASTVLISVCERSRSQVRRADLHESLPLSLYHQELSECVAGWQPSQTNIHAPTTVYLLRHVRPSISNMGLCLARMNLNMAMYVHVHACVRYALNNDAPTR